MIAARASPCSTQQVMHNVLNSCRRPSRVAAAAPRHLTVRTQAAVKPPQGVTLPPNKPVAMPSKFGFVESAERLNSRAAMIGFVLLLLIEGIAGAGILNLAGITTGKGLGFEL